MSVFHQPLAVAALLMCAPPAVAQDLVRLASDEWCPYVCERHGRVQGGYVVDVTARPWPRPACVYSPT